MKFENGGEIKASETFLIDDDVIVSLDTTPQNVELEVESKIDFSHKDIYEEMKETGLDFELKDEYKFLKESKAQRK